MAQKMGTSERQRSHRISACTPKMILFCHTCSRFRPIPIDEFDNIAQPLI